MLTKFFIPGKNNNYHPILIRKWMMVFYAFIIILANFTFPGLGVTPVSADITVDELLQYHNYQRNLAGLQPLKLNTKLSISATSKAQAMLIADCWSHYCPDGKEPWDFFREAGYNYQHAGENLAEGFSDTETLMAAWLNSATHKENILNANFTEVGFGFAYGPFQGKPNNIVVSVHFGSPAENTVSSSSDFNDVDVSELTSFITVDNITNGDVINSSFLRIKGRTNPVNYFVGLTLNKIDKGRIQATGANYDFLIQGELDDGYYEVQAMSYDSSSGVNPSAISDPINILIDGAYPKLTDEFLNISESNEVIYIKFSTTPDVKAIDINFDVLEKSKEGSGNWTLTVERSSIEGTANLVFTMADHSEKRTQFFVDSKSILDLVDSTKDSQIIANDLDQNFSSIKVNLVRNLDANQMLSVLPIVFSIYLILLFSIDYLVLLKTNMLGQIKRKPHINLVVFSILIFILSVGGFTGTILTNAVHI